MADNIIENIEDIDTTLNPVTKDDGLEMLGNVSDQPVVLRRFSRAIFKIGGLIKGLASGKEDKFSKNSGFNKNKSDAVNLNDSNTVATSKAVKLAYERGTSGINKANTAQTKANQAYTLADGKEPRFTKKTGFNLSISHVVNSSSQILVASALAVKKAYDKGLEAVGLTNTNKNAIQNNTEQIENLFAEATETHSYRNVNYTFTKKGNMVCLVTASGTNDSSYVTPNIFNVTEPFRPLASIVDAVGANGTSQKKGELTLSSSGNMSVNFRGGTYCYSTTTYITK